MANTLSYETPAKRRRPELLERFDTPGRMTLIVHPDASSFWAAGAVLIGVVVLSAVVFAGTVGSGVAGVPAFSLVASALGVAGFLAAWNAARTRVVFELLADRLYVAKAGPLTRSQQLWARGTLDDIAVYKFRDPNDREGGTETWRYGIRVRSTYRGRKYVHVLLRDRQVDLLRAVVNELRREFGWAAQKAGDEAEA